MIISEKVLRRWFCLQFHVLVARAHVNNDVYAKNTTTTTSKKNNKRKKTGSTSRRVVSIIKSDGGVISYRRPIKAIEVMEEFPKHLVCRSDCLYIGQKTKPLSQHHRLRLGRIYIILPESFFQSALSFTSFRFAFPTSNTLPLFQVERTSAGVLRVKLSDEYLISIIKQQQEQELADNKTICTTPQLCKDYDQLVARTHRWKPKLDTISEKKVHRNKRFTSKIERHRYSVKKVQFQ